jgi:DNA-binding transcriptional LysR family regulator
MIDIRVLLDFAAVGDTLSFSAAARQTNVAQPRLSAQVKKLETLVGTPLFDRTTRRVVFTPAGQRLYDMVRPIAQAVETLLTDVAALRTGCKGRLGLGTVILAEPDRRLADIISAFGKSHPEVDISIEAGSPEVHLARLAHRSLDLAFCPEVEPVDDHDSLPLHPVAFAVMMAADDPLAQMPALRPEDFAGRSVAIMQRTRNPAFSTASSPRSSLRARSLSMSLNCVAPFFEISPASSSPPSYPAIRMPSCVTASCAAVSKACQLCG